MAATIGRLRAVLSANTTEFNQGFEKAKRSLNRFNGNMRFTRKQLKRFVEVSSNAAQPLSVSLKQANTVLSSTGASLKHVDSALNKLSSAYENARTSQARFAIGAKMKELHTLKSSMMGTSGAVKSIKSSFGGANMAVVNFNRVIQDSPYGIIGVANNIEPLLLSLKGLKQSTGSAMGAFKLLIKSAFTGPGALITVFSLASTAAVFFAMKMRGAGSASKEAEENIKATTSAINELENVFNSLAGFSIVQKAEQDLKQIDEAIKLANERNDFEKEYNKIKNSLVLLVQNDPRRAAYKKEIETIDLKIQRLGFEKTALEDLTKERELAVKKIEDLNNAQSEEAKIGKKINEIRANVKSSITNLNLGYDDSLDKINRLISSLQKEFKTYKELGKENKHYAILAEALQNELDKLEKSVEKLNKTNSEYKAPDFVPPRFSSLDLLKQDLKDIEKLIADSMEDTQKLIDGAEIDFSKLLPMGSIAYVEDQMNKVKEAIRLATSDEERDSLRQRLVELEDQLKNMDGSNVVNEISKIDEAISTFLENLGIKSKEAFKLLNDALTNSANALKDAIGQTFLTFGDMMGKAFAGVDDSWHTAFEKIILVVLDFVATLAKIFAAAGAAIMFIPGAQGLATAILLGAATLQALASGFSAGINKRANNRQQRASKQTSVNDALITSDGQVIKFHPNDNILAMKDFGKLGGIINQQPPALNNIGSPSLNNIRRVQPIYLESTINLDGRQIYKGIQLTKARINR